MGKLSDSGGDDAIKAALGISPSAARYLALCTAAPTDGAIGAEIATPGQNGYSRQLVAFGAPGDASGKRQCANTGTLLFGPFTADLAEATHVMVMDHATTATAASMKAWAALDEALNPAVNDSIEFAIGELKWSVD
jgi:hypothetical protein